MWQTTVLAGLPACQKRGYKRGLPDFSAMSLSFILLGLLLFHSFIL